MVTVYSMPNCPGCKQAKQLLKSLGVSYVEKDVISDQKAMNELSEMGSMSLPTLVIDDMIIIGYQEQEIKRLLKK